MPSEGSGTRYICMKKSMKKKPAPVRTCEWCGDSFASWAAVKWCPAHRSPQARVMKARAPESQREPRAKGKYVRIRVPSVRTQIRVHLWKFKADKGCARCSEKDPRCLEFHHIDPDDKSFTLGKAAKWETLEAELEKCIVLCCNCHAKEHRSAPAELSEEEEESPWDLTVS